MHIYNHFSDGIVIIVS
jgi:hypothetical protein